MGSTGDDLYSIPWRVTRDVLSPMTPFSADPRELRWVGTDFVYFGDIPWKGISGCCTLETIRSVTISLLENITDRQISVESLSGVSSAGAAVLCGDRLARLIVPWSMHLRRNIPHANDPTFAAYQQWGKHVTQAITQAAVTIDQDIYPFLGSVTDHRTPGAELLCALLTFIASLGKCVLEIWGDRDASQRLVQRFQMYRDVIDIFHAKVKATWGKSQYRIALGQLLGGYAFSAYIATCQPTTNKSLTVDPNTYRTQHVLSSCTCTFVSPSIDRVCDLLSEGRIPVVAYNGSGITVRAASEGPYVAISHVWADGLGSTSEVGLPTCQLARLSKLASQLCPLDGAFWIDGLCVPGAAGLRRRAIKLMAQTYAQAANVLVIDEGIRTLCSLSSPKEDCIIRISTSGWMQRIWTLQEGMLARELYFEFSDGLVGCTFFNGASYSASRRIVPLFRFMPQDDANLRYLGLPRDPPRCSVNDLIPLIRYRTTSKPEDEPLALSGLLRVDAAKLVGLRTRDERMRMLFIEVGVLNRQIGLHGWLCDRVSLPNFSWAPASLKEVMWPGDSDDRLVATCTAEGLTASYCVVHFPTVMATIQDGIVITVGETASDARSKNAVRAPYTLNVVISQYVFESRKLKVMKVDGILLKTALRSRTMRDEAVAVVSIEEAHWVARALPLQCKFAAPGSASSGPPGTVQTVRSKKNWKKVAGVEVPRVNIRLT